ncbi:hypothetical protein FRC00_004348 [Tulasnella sp. 408]|nr:hypothetical protein FRC00_004348 [Tulasnella sp. 408]
MKDMTWLHEMRYREAHKAVSEIWKDLKRLTDELQDKETAMLTGHIGQEREGVPMPTATPASDGPRLWGSIRPPVNDELAFDEELAFDDRE